MSFFENILIAIIICRNVNRKYRNAWLNNGLVTLPKFSPGTIFHHSTLQLITLWYRHPVFRNAFSDGFDIYGINANCRSTHIFRSKTNGENRFIFQAKLREIESILILVRGSCSRRVLKGCTISVVHERKQYFLRSKARPPETFSSSFKRVYKRLATVPVWKPAGRNIFAGTLFARQVTNNAFSRVTSSHAARTDVG